MCQLYKSYTKERGEKPNYSPGVRNNVEFILDAHTIKQQNKTTRLHILVHNSALS